MKQNYNKKTTTSVSFKSFVPLTRSVIGKNSTNVQLDYSLVGISVQPLMCRDKLCKLIFRDTNSSNIARIFDIYHLIEISSNKQIIKDQSVDVDLVVELNYKTIIINKIDKKISFNFIVQLETNFTDELKNSSKKYFGLQGLKCVENDNLNLQANININNNKFIEQKKITNNLIFFDTYKTSIIFPISVDLMLCLNMLKGYNELLLNGQKRKQKELAVIFIGSIVRKIVLGAKEIFVGEFKISTLH